MLAWREKGQRGPITTYHCYLCLSQLMGGRAVIILSCMLYMFVLHPLHVTQTRPFCE
jgi:hypothetical protein